MPLILSSTFHLYVLNIFCDNSSAMGKIVSKPPQRSTARQKPRKATIREREEILRALVNATTESLLLLDMEHNFLFMNEVVAQRLGKPVESLIGTYVYDHLPPDVARFRKECFEVVVATRKAGTFESSREGRFYKEHFCPVFDNQGNVSRVAVFASDITEQKKIEDFLRQSEEKYRTLFDNANDAVFLLRKGTIVECNARSLMVFGCDEEKIVGRPFHELSPPFQADGTNSRKTTQEKIRAALNGLSQFFEWQHKRHSGGIFDTEVSLNTLVLEGETFVQAIVRDVSMRKQAERLLKESEERYRILTEKSTVGIYLLQNNLFQYVNNAFAGILGYAPWEIVDTLGLVDFVVSEDQPFVANSLQREVDGETEDEHYECRVKRKDGTIRHMEIFGSRLMYNGRPAVMGTVVDITRRKETEQQLAVERRRFRILSEDAPFGLVMIDARGNFTYVNPKFRELFGYNLGDIPDGKTWFHKAYPDPDYRRTVVSVWIRDLRKAKAGGFRPKVFTVACSDGTEKIVNFVPVLLGSGETIISCEDITEQKRAEQDRERLVLELRDALSKVKTLSGLLPVCASCKKIRNDKGYWEQMETYIKEHSEADFSHGICPECAQKLYPDYYKKLYSSRGKKK
jgi:two-component system, cell cycle sensor histidine kinase and response regulator CckA